MTTTPKKPRVRIYTKDLKAEIASLRLEINDLRDRLAHVNDEDFKDIHALQTRTRILEARAFSPPPISPPKKRFGWFFT